jgi:hypothetical protein
MFRKKIRKLNEDIFTNIYVIFKSSFINTHTLAFLKGIYLLKHIMHTCCKFICMHRGLNFAKNITSPGHRGLTYAIYWLYAMSIGYGWKYIPTQHRSGLKNLQHMYSESQLATAASVSHVALSLSKGRKGTGSRPSWPLVGNCLALLYRKELYVALQWKQVHRGIGFIV